MRAHEKIPVQKGANLQTHIAGVGADGWMGARVVACIGQIKALCSSARGSCVIGSAGPKSNLCCILADGVCGGVELESECHRTSEREGSARKREVFIQLAARKAFNSRRVVARARPFAGEG